MGWKRRGPDSPLEPLEEASPCWPWLWPSSSWLWTFYLHNCERIHFCSFESSIVCMRAKSLQSCLTLCNPMNGSHQAPLSMEVSRQEYWSGLLCPPPGDLPDPGIELRLMSPALAGGFFTASTTLEAPSIVWWFVIVAMPPRQRPRRQQTHKLRETGKRERSTNKETRAKRETGRKCWQHLSLNVDGFCIFMLPPSIFQVVLPTHIPQHQQWIISV